jgi:hypothetical protein
MGTDPGRPGGRACVAGMGEEPLADHCNAGREPSLPRLGNRRQIPTGNVSITSPILLTAHNVSIQAQSNPIYACLILSWSTTEIIRYTFYAFSLLSPSIPYPLLYLRYTTFYVLYPTGAASEAFLILSTLPVGKHGWAGMLSGHDMPRPAALLKSWGLLDYARAGLFAFWWFGTSLPRAV